MAGLEHGDDRPTWDEHAHRQDIQHDRGFLNENCPRDPMILALPLMELRNLVIDPQLARAMQGLYEDMGRRYLDMSALLQAYVAQHRRNGSSEGRPARNDGASRLPRKPAGGS